MKSTATWPERLYYSTKSNDCMIIGEESVSQSPSKWSDVGKVFPRVSYCFSLAKPRQPTAA